MGELRRISPCHGAPLAEVPSKDGADIVECTECLADFIATGTWECKDNKHPVTPDLGACNKCKCSVFVPTLKKPDERPRCGVCGQIRQIIVSNGGRPCEEPPGERNCGELSVARAMFGQRNKDQNLPRYVRHTQLPGKQEYVEVAEAEALRAFKDNAMWNAEHIPIPRD